jgi:hypothetical protein
VNFFTGSPPIFDSFASNTSVDSTSAEIDQYSSGTKHSISRSLSTIILSAGL